MGSSSSKSSSGLGRAQRAYCIWQGGQTQATAATKAAATAKAKAANSRRILTSEPGSSAEPAWFSWTAGDATFCDDSWLPWYCQPPSHDVFQHSSSSSTTGAAGRSSRACCCCPAASGIGSSSSRQWAGPARLCPGPYCHAAQRSSSSTSRDCRRRSSSLSSSKASSTNASRQTGSSSGCCPGCWSCWCLDRRTASIDSNAPEGWCQPDSSCWHCDSCFCWAYSSHEWQGSSR